jgi:hypothetical protein
MKHISHTINKWTEKKSRQIAIHMLEGMLKWSDRIGSDEISTIEGVILILKNK